jgi:hypothetical protein
MIFDRRGNRRVGSGNFRLAAKLAKFRASPEQFFADSRNVVVRTLGLSLVPHLAQSELASAMLEDPREALRERDIPVLREWIGRHETTLARTRREILSRAGCPRVSVVMAAWNAADSIENAIGSVLDQSYAELELIVVDDASQDSTREIVRTLASRDPRVRLVRNDRQRGAAVSRNVGLTHASGAYLTFQDADDISHPERIERQLAALLSRSDALFCICNYRRETPEGKRVVINGRRFGKSIISMLLPRDPVFERVGYMLDLRVGEDSEYYQRIRATFGSRSELHLFQTLYRARYAAGSLLFSHGATTETNDGITYIQSPVAREAYDRAMERVEAIRRGETSPFVDFAG